MEHRFVAVLNCERILRNVPGHKGEAIDQITVIGYEDNGQRWGFVRRLWRAPDVKRGGLSRGREEDRGWVRLPGAFLEDEIVFDTSVESATLPP